MNKVILADSEAIFRAGQSKCLPIDDFRIVAQCVDVEQMMHATTTFPGAIVLFASSLHPEMGRLLMMLEAAGSRAIVIAENNESAEAYLRQGFRGAVPFTGDAVEAPRVGYEEVDTQWIKPRPRSYTAAK